MYLKWFLLGFAWFIVNFNVNAEVYFTNSILMEIERNIYNYDMRHKFHLSPFYGEEEEIKQLVKQEFEQLNMSRCGEGCLNNVYQNELLQRDQRVIADEFYNFCPENEMMANFYLTYDKHHEILIFKGQFSNGHKRGCEYHLIYDQTNFEGFIGLFNCK